MSTIISFQLFIMLLHCTVLTKFCCYYGCRGCGSLVQKFGNEQTIILARGRHKHSGYNYLLEWGPGGKKTPQKKKKKQTLSNPCKKYDCSRGDCKVVNRPDGSKCGFMGDGLCQKPDTCIDGKCITNQVQDLGTPCGDQTESSCDKADSCDADGNCLPNYMEDGHVCGVEETDCMTAESCSNGVCSPAAPKPIFTPCGNQTDTACNKADYCSGFGVCLSNLIDKGTKCGDAAGDCDAPE